MRMRRLICLLCLTMAVFLFSCGESDVSAPPQSKITLFLPNSDVTSADTTSLGESTGYLTIAVFDENDKPIRDAKISIHYPWAVPNSFAVQFYDGQDPVDSPFDAHTDDFGVYTLMFTYQIGCLTVDTTTTPPTCATFIEYNGAFEVRTGTNFASIDFSVKGP
ncbi:MAG: hypothetical protein ACM34I_05790 [bacterium]